MRFTLEADHKTVSEKLAKSGMTPVVMAQRTSFVQRTRKIQFGYSNELGISCHTVELWVKKYRSRTLKDSFEDLLKVSKGCGRKEEITGEARIWLISTACMKPKDLGYVADNLMPNESCGVIKHDYEYKHLGTVSLLAGIDLQKGEAIPLVKDTHNSDDYIEFLRMLDCKYPKGVKICLVLDNY